LEEIIESLTTNIMHTVCHKTCTIDPQHPFSEQVLEDAEMANLGQLH